MADKYAVPADPADIDEEYVQRVINVMDELYGAAFHALYYDDAGFGDEAFVAPLQAGYTDPAFDAMVQGFDLSREAGFPNVRTNPGLRRRELYKMRTVSNSCLELTLVSDFSDVVEELPADNRQPVIFVTLVLAAELDDPGALNPTPWQTSHDVVSYDGPPESRCDY